MKFKITCTSGRTPPCEGATLEGDDWFLTILTTNGLKEFMSKVDSELFISSTPAIEIYDMRVQRMETRKTMENRITKEILGERVRDSVSGLTGIATSFTEYLGDSPAVGITPERLHDGKAVECQYFSTWRIEQVPTGS